LQSRKITSMHSYLHVIMKQAVSVHLRGDQCDWKPTPYWQPAPNNRNWVAQVVISIFEGQKGNKRTCAALSAQAFTWNCTLWQSPSQGRRASKCAHLLPKLTYGHPALPKPPPNLELCLASEINFCLKLGSQGELVKFNNLDLKL